MRQALVLAVLVLGAVSLSAASAMAQGADRQATARAWDRPPPRSPAVSVTLAPEWGYRSFLDREPSTTDKRYTAPGIPMASARLEVYPLAFVSPAIEVGRDFGVTVGYSRAFAVKSRDIDDDAKIEGTDIDTQWYQFSFGARYRVLGGTSPLDLGFTLGIQRWVFDFEVTPPSRPVAVARYTLLPAGVDARYRFGAFALFADARFILPLSVSPLGDRTTSGVRLGFNAALGAAFAFSRFFEVEARGTYTLLSLGLAAVGDRPDERGTVIDEYLVFGLGATFHF